VARGTLGIALACVLLSFLMMITRTKAIPQVIGFLAMENALFFAATSATYGMPMVVELGIALDVLVGADHPRRVLVPDPRAVRQPRHPPSGTAEGRLSIPTMEALLALLGIPLLGAAVLGLFGHRDMRRGRQHRLQPGHLRRRRRAHRAWSSPAGRSWCCSSSSSSTRSTSSWSR
jgi:hypothetical protein